MKELLKHPLIAAVLAGIILSALGWVSGLINIVWLWFIKTLTSIISTLSTNVDIPLWLLLFLVLTTFIWVIKLSINSFKLFKKNKAVININDSIEIEEQEETVLSNEEVSFLKYLVSEDGKSVKLTSLRYKLRISQLETEQILESLSEYGLVKVTNDWVHGAYVKLTREGRDFILGNKYART